MSMVNGDVEDHHHVAVDIELAAQIELQGLADEGGEAEEAELIYAQQEIRNLLEIRRLPEEDFWKVAEEEWEKSANLFGERVESKKKQVLNVTNEIYQLVGFSSAFQGLLLTAVSQASLLSCKTKWWVLTLSLFASFVTAAGVWGKNIVISDLQETIDTEDPTRKKYVKRLGRLKELGPNKIDLRHITQREEKRTPPELPYLKKSGQRLCSYRSMIFFCLCTFGVLCAVAIDKILCDQECKVVQVGS